MFVAINPSADCFDETVGVLKFSKIADKVSIFYLLSGFFLELFIDLQNPILAK